MHTRRTILNVNPLPFHKSFELVRCFIVETKKEGDASESCKESYGASEAGYVRCVVTRTHRFSMDIPIHFRYEDVLCTTMRCYWETAGEVCTDRMGERQDFNVDMAS